MKAPEIDFTDTTKTKKTAYTLSVTILLLAALDLRSDQINLFGLIVGIDKAKITFILQLFLGVATAILIGKLAVIFSEYRTERARTRKTQEEQQDASEERSMYIDPDHELDDRGPAPEDYEIHFSKRRKERKKKIEKAENLNDLIRRLISQDFEVVFLILIVGAAFIYPETLRNLLPN